MNSYEEIMRLIKTLKSVLLKVEEGYVKVTLGGQINSRLGLIKMVKNMKKAKGIFKKLMVLGHNNTFDDKEREEIEKEAAVLKAQYEKYNDFFKITNDVQKAIGKAVVDEGKKHISNFKRAVFRRKGWRDDKQ